MKFFLGLFGQAIGGNFQGSPNHCIEVFGCKYQKALPKIESCDRSLRWPTLHWDWACFDQCQSQTQSWTSTAKHNFRLATDHSTKNCAVMLRGVKVDVLPRRSLILRGILWLLLVALFICIGMAGLQ
jgi:hypothetical protein